MEIELYNGDAKAIVSPRGGYITNLANDDGDILFPKRTLRAPDGSEKVRGGCHVCLPNFGPGGESGLAQHGFGRTGEWAIAGRSETFVELTLAGEGEYKGVDSLLRYELQLNSLQMVLTLKNKGKSPVKVSPGFHPYFFRGGQAVQLNGIMHKDGAEFNVAKFIEGEMHELSLAGRMLQLHSDNLTQWALWTDELADYFCIEPTRAGNAFAEQMANADTLLPGAAQTYSFTLQW